MLKRGVGIFSVAGHENIMEHNGRWWKMMEHDGTHVARNWIFSSRANWMMKGEVGIFSVAQTEWWSAGGWIWVFLYVPFVLRKDFFLLSYLWKEIKEMVQIEQMEQDTARDWIFSLGLRRLNAEGRGAEYEYFFMFLLFNKRIFFFFHIYEMK